MSVAVQGVCEGLVALSAPDRTLLLLLLLLLRLFLFLLVLDIVFVELGDALDDLATSFALEQTLGQLLLLSDTRFRLYIWSVVGFHLLSGPMAIIRGAETSGSREYRLIRRLTEFLLFFGLSGGGPELLLLFLLTSGCVVDIPVFGNVDGLFELPFQIIF